MVPPRTVSITRRCDRIHRARSVPVAESAQALCVEKIVDAVTRSDADAATQCEGGMP
jgi:hypothetical protein